MHRFELVQSLLSAGESCCTGTGVGYLSSPHLTQPAVSIWSQLHVVAQLSSAPVHRRCSDVGGTMYCISTWLNFSTLYPERIKTVVLPGLYNTAVNHIILDPYAGQVYPSLCENIALSGQYPAAGSKRLVLG